MAPRSGTSHSSPGFRSRQQRRFGEKVAKSARQHDCATVPKRSVAGDEDRSDVNVLFAQYFINYNFGNGWYATSAPAITANWEADSGEKWTVPFGGGIGRLVRIGSSPVDLQGQVFYHAVRPENGPGWGFRIQCKLLFPT